MALLSTETHIQPQNLVENITARTVITKDKISLDVDFSVTNAPVETSNFVLWQRTQSV